MYQNPAPPFLTVTLRSNPCKLPVPRAVLSRAALFYAHDISKTTRLGALISIPRLKA